MRKGLRIEGSRPDGVLLVNLGDRQLVMVNVVDHVKTAVLSERQVEAHGPWMACDEVKPDEAARKMMMTVLDQPGNIVPVTAVGALDFDYRDVQNLTAPTRQEFADMLQSANLDVASELPDARNFQDDGQFFQHCISEIVPSLTAAGVTIENPNSFCALMHLERTGIMPRATMAEGAAMAATPPPMQPVAQASDPAASPTVPSPAVQPTVGMSMSDDGPSNVALAVTPGEPPAEELPDLPDLDGGDEGDEGDEGEDGIAAKVQEVDAALDNAATVVNELMQMLGIAMSEEFENCDKSLSLAAKLQACRNCAMPPAPNDAGMPESEGTEPKASAAPHGVPGGKLGVAAAEAFPGAAKPFGAKDASEVAGKTDEKPDAGTEGKPEVTSQPTAMGGTIGPAANPVSGGSTIGKPNKKKTTAVVEACGTPPKP